MEILSVNNTTYLPEAKAIINSVPSAEAFKEPDSTIDIGKYKKIVPWGENNDMPQQIITKSGKCEVVGANLQFNIMAGYGQGIQAFRKTGKGKDAKFEEIEEGEVYDFLQDNDVNLFLLESLTDMHTFFNIFPEIILSTDYKKIVSLRAKEAAFSRWQSMDKKSGRILKHFYCGKWDDSPSEADITESDVLDRYNPLRDLQQRIESRKSAYRFIVPVSFPTPGRSYYAFAYWWSIFLSGWYDYLTMVPGFKKAVMKNQLGVRYIIYLSERYWDILFARENIDTSDKEAVEARKQKEHANFQSFLTGEENAGKGILALKRMVNSASGSAEEKLIEIVEIKNSMKGGEYIEDSQEAASIISYAMQVHQPLIGNPPKDSGSLSGSDARERFMMKVGLMTPFRDRILKVLHLIRRFNGWGDDIVFKIPDFEFTKLDDNKAGKQTVVQTPNSDNNADQ
jgi:hypothetical protein